MNLAQQTSRANTIARAVTTLLSKSAARRVRALVEDAGGTWAGLLAVTATAKVRATLNEPENAAVIHYHSVSATREWPAGSADDALQPVACRVARRIGPLLPNSAMLFAARLLVDLAGSHPEHLTPAEARNVKARVGR